MYGKLFEQMFDGTLATKGPWQALVTFQQLIILADKSGTVDMTAEAISRRTTIPLEIIETGLQELILPDPKSRTPVEEGRRIVSLSSDRDWGWRIVNYEHYRKIRSEEERREYHRRYYHEKRKTQTISQHLNPDSSDSTKAVSSKQYAVSKGNTTAASVPLSANGIESIPLKGGLAWDIPEVFLAEIDRLYPNVEPKQTLREIRGWCLGNEDRLKTKRGVRRFIVGWFAKEQEKHGRKK